MSEPASKTSSRTAMSDAPADTSLFSEIRRTAALYWASRERNRLLMLAAGVFVVIAVTAHMQVRLNAWNQPFYDAVTRKDVPEFIAQLGVFAVLAAILLTLNVAQVWLNQTTRLTLRRSLVHDMIDEWLKPLRAFRLSNSGSIGANPDQRMSADAQHLSDLVTDLVIGLIQSTLLLLSFIGVLWFLSQGMFVPWRGRHIQVPGYLVWCALLYSAAASFLSWRVGRPLIALNSERYAREAELRFALVRVSEDIEGITIAGGEAGEKQLLDQVLESVLEVTGRIVGAVSRLTWVTSGYGWFTIVAPILVAAPSYLAGKMTFGQLMVAVGAFNQVQTCLRWFVDNFSMLADWRATRRRVASFQRAVVTMDGLGRSVDHIQLDESQDQSMIRIDDLSIAATDGSFTLSQAQVELRPGERTQIVGERRAAGTLLLNAIVGIWPWGRGRITRPSRQAMMFLPARAYVPPGTLRAALAYPHAATDYDDTAIGRALADVGLEHLQPLLDITDRWDRRLDENEKQTLAFARVCLRRPQWLVVNGALEALAPASRTRIEALFAGPFSNVGLIEIGQRTAPEGFFTRKLHLVNDPSGPTFTLVEDGVSAPA